VLELDASCNDVGDLGVAVLAQHLIDCKLTSLDLTDAGVGPAGCRALQTHLPYGCLVSLTLDGNVLGNSGVASVAQCLASCGLKHLSLSRIGIENVDGLRSLVQAITGSCVRCLDVCVPGTRKAMGCDRSGWPLSHACFVCDELRVSSPFLSRCRGKPHEPLSVGDVVAVANVVLLSGIPPWLAAQPIHLYRLPGIKLHY
jgi:hypothetical protein